MTLEEIIRDLKELKNNLEIAISSLEDLPKPTDKIKKKGKKK